MLLKRYYDEDVDGNADVAAAAAAAAVAATAAAPNVYDSYDGAVDGAKYLPACCFCFLVYSLLLLHAIAPNGSDGNKLVEQVGTLASACCVSGL